MLLRNWRGGLLPGLVLAAFVLAAPAAQAFTCTSTLTLSTADASFEDCSGTTNFVGFDFGTLEHVTALDGGFFPDDFFTDFHVTFLDPEVTIVSGFFVNDIIVWDQMISPDSKTIWWVAPTFDDRVIGGQSPDDYDWFLGLAGASGLNELNVTLEYTMDLPEPSAALLLAPAFLGLVGLTAARRRRLS